MKSVLTVLDLAVEFPTPGGRVRAVDGVSFEVSAGQTLALVGESGSGKTLSALAVLGLIPAPGRLASGRAFFREQNILRLSERELRTLRGPGLGIVFQDPLSALHPLLTIGRQLTETIEAHERVSRREALRRSAEGLEEVGLRDPERCLAAYPHELSGGMRQRVLIAMACLLRPALLFADEPTTALDASLQGQVLELFRELQRRHGMALVLISHDLPRVATIADHVQVLYAGRTVENAPTTELFARPLHPYTQGLIRSVPDLVGQASFPLPTIAGHPPDAVRRPAGCAFHPRCELVQEPCRRDVPALERVGGSDARRSACFEVKRLLGAKR